MEKHKEAGEGLQNFCRNVRRLRLLHQLSQNQMAQLMRIGVKSLRKIESGVIPPRLSCEVLCYLHNAFDVSTETLFRAFTETEKQ